MFTIISLFRNQITVILSLLNSKTSAWKLFSLPITSLTDEQMVLMFLCATAMMVCIPSLAQVVIQGNNISKVFNEMDRY